MSSPDSQEPAGCYTAWNCRAVLVRGGHARAMVANLGTGVTTWKLGTEYRERSDTAVSEDAPEWFRISEVKVLANMRPAFDPHAHENKQWHRQDTALSAGVPEFMAGPYSVFWGMPEYAHADYVIGQHTPRSRVMNASHEPMLLNDVGPPGRRRRLIDATLATANALHTYPPGQMHEARRQELQAALRKAQTLIASGRVLANEALRPRGNPRPTSAPPGAYAARAALVSTSGVMQSTMRSSRPPSASSRSSSNQAELHQQPNDRGSSRPSTAPPTRNTGVAYRVHSESTGALSSSAFGSLSRIGEEAVDGGNSRRHTAKGAAAHATTRPRSAFAVTPPDVAADIALVHGLRNLSFRRYDPVIDGIGGTLPTATAQRELFQKYGHL